LIFEQETISFEILDVFSLNQENVKMTNSGRNFDAISFRYDADTVVETGRKQIEFKKNSVGFFPANVDYTRISRKDDLIVIHFNSLSYHSKDIEYFYPENHEKLSELFKKIAWCWSQKSASYKHKASAIMYEIFALCYEENKQEKFNSKIKASVDYINNNYLNPDFSLSDAVKKSFMSEVYFRKLFKGEFNTSPKKYIIAAKIKHAVSLINSGLYTLKEIATLCGYTDYKYFSVEFKKMTGKSPSEYTYCFTLPHNE